MLKGEAGGRCICGSHFPPAEAGLVTCSCRVNAFKKGSQPGRRPELWDGFQFFEG